MSRLQARSPSVDEWRVALARSGLEGGCGEIDEVREPEDSALPYALTEREKKIAITCMNALRKT